ncbi:MAG: phosphoenolpyruvate-utilizing N-terminal domain-containing protein [Christensenellales bacterium]|jgi:phosphotransferase system enzyme I (PtsI)
MQIGSRTYMGGVAVGYAAVDSGEKGFALKQLEQIEQRHLDEAILRTARKYLAMADYASQELDEEDATGFDPVLTILKDRVFTWELTALVRYEKYRAEDALREVCDGWTERFERINTAFFGGRDIEMDELKEELLNALRTVRRQRRSIFIMKKLAIHELEKLDAAAAVSGIAVERAMRIPRDMKTPVIAGVRNILRRVKDGALVILDADNGFLIAEPGGEELDIYKSYLQELSLEETGK